MTDLMKSLSLSALVALGGPALAQDASDAPADAPAQETQPAETGQAQAQQSEPSQPAAPQAQQAEGAPSSGQQQTGQPYVAGTFGDWQQRCVKTQDGRDPCQIYQLLKDQTGNPTAEISIVPLVDSPPAEASATMVTPLETLLSRQITLQVDQQQAKTYPFTVCMQQACIARIAFTAPEVQSMKRGNAAVMTIVPFAAPDQTIDLTISLSGFTAAYDATAKSNRGG